VCGIFGLVLDNPKVCSLTSAIERLRHRGPDGWGTMHWSSGRPPVLDAPGEEFAKVAFAHRRLSIIDLSDAGKQPMRSHDGRWWLTYNGEIYNYIELRGELEGSGHKFLSNSDTEVVLQAISHWGFEAAVGRFNGMFALAALDTNQNLVYLARDPFGIKPLFFCRWRDGLAFSSEPLPLRELPGVGHDLNPQRCWDFLRFGITDHTSDTLLKSLSQVQSGCFVCVSLLDVATGLPEPKRYWNVRSISGRSVPFGTAVEQVREQFLHNVRLHMRSDVPIGAALSGGVDSSAIVCSMRHLYPKQEIHTYTYLADDARLNEQQWADLVNNHVRAIAHPVLPSPKALSKDIRDTIKFQGEPFGSTSIYAQYCVFQAAALDGIKVMLDGQGADEMLGGYAQYQGSRLASIVRSGNIGRALSFLRAQGAWNDRSIQNVLYLAANTFIPAGLRPVARRLVGHADELPSANMAWFQEHGTILGSPFFVNGSRSQLRDDLKQSIAETMAPLLRYEDRNSMAHSIESRVPFLTADLASTVVSLPESLLVNDQGVSKHVFREAMRGIVPDPILDRRDKIGFATPEKDWLLNPAQTPLIADAISAAQDNPALDAMGLRMLSKKSLSGKVPYSSTLWRSLNFALWYREVKNPGR
jgi:asparagine synthase (glutamine-hydrolysing)